MDNTSKLRTPRTEASRNGVWVLRASPATHIVRASDNSHIDRLATPSIAHTAMATAVVQARATPAMFAEGRDGTMKERATGARNEGRRNVLKGAFKPFIVHP